MKKILTAIIVSLILLPQVYMATFVLAQSSTLTTINYPVEASSIYPYDLTVFFQGMTRANTDEYTFADLVTFNDDAYIGGSNKELRFYEGANWVGFEAGSLSANQIWVLPIADGSADDVMTTDGNGNLTFSTITVDVPIVIPMYDPEPSRGSETNWNGGLLELDNAASVSSGVPFNISTKGSGKILIVVNAGSDLVGDITLTGTSVDRNDQSQTGSDASVITLTGATTDDSVVDDGNGNTVHMYTKAYITDKWFTGVVQITTADTAITDMDIYHVSFEQLNDSPNITLDTFDINLDTTNVAAEFDAYLYTIHVTGDEVNIHNEAKLNVGTGTYALQAALANKYFRLREGNINDSLDGTTDGFWVDIHYSNSPSYVEDVTGKVWFTESISLTLN